MNETNQHIRIDHSANRQQRVSVIHWIGKSEETDKDKSGEDECALLNGKRKVLTSSTCFDAKSINKATKYDCLFCGKSFKWYSHWKSHERTHTGERPFKCEICGKTFTRSDGLNCHKLIHFTRMNSHYPPANEGIQTCTKSGTLAYTTVDWPKSNYGRNLQKVTTKWLDHAKLFNCHLCHRNFFSSSGLLKHMQRHKGKSNFVCEVCNMMFTKRSALKIHGRIHTGEKPYQCNICTKAFSINGNLKRHLLIHTGERPYKCLQCTKCFNNPSHLTRHVKKKHPEKEENYL